MEFLPAKPLALKYRTSYPASNQENSCNKSAKGKQENIPTPKIPVSASSHGVVTSEVFSVLSGTLAALIWNCGLYGKMTLY